jgi:hypothetical protein
MQIILQGGAFNNDCLAIPEDCRRYSPTGPNWWAAYDETDETHPSGRTVFRYNEKESRRPQAGF